MASDMVIAPAYNLTWAGLTHPHDFDLPTGQHFEWYANRLSAMGIHMDGPAPSEGDSCAEGEAGEGSAASSSELSEKQDEDSTGGSSGENKEQNEQKENSEEASSGGADSEESDGSLSTENSKESEEKDGTESFGDYTSLWEEDAFMGQQITDIIHSTTQWGSLPGDMVELIKKAAEGKIDYRGALRTFRSSILSQKRRLTRMRPSRRFGFEQMGSHYDFTTRLLIAIDTSGSVGSEELGRYFRIITTFFKYGIQEIDVLMFDHEVQGEPITFTEAKKNIQEFKVRGRGGTNFQAPIDYVKENPNYDGLIIITDGYAPTPEVPPFLRAKLLWVIDNEPSYKKHYESLRKTGRVCLMEL
jgi:predicted metal-dependent peptidase